MIRIVRNPLYLQNIPLGHFIDEAKKYLDNQYIELSRRPSDKIKTSPEKMGQIYRLICEYIKQNRGANQMEIAEYVAQSFPENKTQVRWYLYGLSNWGKSGLLNGGTGSIWGNKMSKNNMQLPGKNTVERESK